MKSTSVSVDDESFVGSVSVSPIIYIGDRKQQRLAPVDAMTKFDLATYTTRALDGDKGSL